MTPSTTVADHPEAFPDAADPSLQSGGDAKGGDMELMATTTIRQPVHETFSFWHELENLPRFMTHLDEVRKTRERTSHWIASAAGAPLRCAISSEATRMDRSRRKHLHAGQS